MIERKYSLGEIDAMRNAVYELTAGIVGRTDMALVEDRLRTYMMAGVDPQELVDKGEGRRKELVPKRNEFFAMESAAIKERSEANRRPLLATMAA